MRSYLLAAAALCAALLSLPLHAERTLPRNALFGDEDSSRVIVRYRADATMLRAHALSAGNSGAHARTLEDRAAALAARHGLPIRAAGAVSEQVQVVTAEGVSARALAARLMRDADVESAVPDRRARATLVPNDTLFNSGGAQGPAVGQWYLRTPTAGGAPSSIDAVSAWSTTTGSASVIVAVLDTGITDHPDLAGKVLPGYDMVDSATVGNDGSRRDADPHDPGDWVTSADLANSVFNGCSVSPSSWHGTLTAGIIGAATNNSSGMAGAGWDVRILPVRVLGKCFGYTSDIAAGIRWAAGLSVPGVPANLNKANVINLSLGSDGACSSEEQSAVDAALAAGVVVVAAAGNTTGRAANSPSNCRGVIGVAAIRHVGSKVGFSDVGPELSIAAPGGNCVNIGPGEPCLYPILTTVNKGTQGPAGFGYTDSFDISVGTSFSSPLVAATAALMLSAQPALTPVGVRAALQASARTFPQSGLVDENGLPLAQCQAPGNFDQLQCYCTRTTCGAGMLDAGAAVRAVLGINLAINVAPAAPTANQTITLSSAGSTVAPGRSIAARAWALASGGGIVTALDDAGTGVTTTLKASRAGTLSVRLTITDDQGVAASTTQSVSVAADPNAPPPASSGGGGGGPMSWAWLFGLALATAGVAWARPRRAAR